MYCRRNDYIGDQFRQSTLSHGDKNCRTRYDNIIINLGNIYDYRYPHRPSDSTLKCFPCGCYMNFQVGLCRQCHILIMHDFCFKTSVTKSEFMWSAAEPFFRIFGALGTNPNLKRNPISTSISQPQTQNIEYCIVCAFVSNLWKLRTSH